VRRKLELVAQVTQSRGRRLPGEFQSPQRREQERHRDQRDDKRESHLARHLSARRR